VLRHALSRYRPPVNGLPQNVGSQRLLELAERGELHDRALWTPPVTATGAGAARPR
jgi:alkanesulfonate monooxygenase